MSEDADEPLAELRLERHRDLAGRRYGPLVVRGIVAVLTGFVILAALNAFGQGASTSQAKNRVGRLEVTTPARVRGGLIFQTRVDVHAYQRIAKPAVILAGGWFDGMTLNSYQPPATSQVARGSAVTFTYPPLAAGRSMTIWLEWSVNPTNVAWRRPEPITLTDGRIQIVRLTPTVTVYP